MVKDEPKESQIISVSFSSSYKDAFENQSISILYPRSSIPVILEPTQSFIMQLQSVAFESI